MYRLFTSLLLGYMLNAIMLAVVSSDRSEEDGLEDKKGRLDKMLQVENAHLKEELVELRSELRVAASGSLIQKKETHDEEPPHKHHKHPKHHHHKNAPSGSKSHTNGHQREIQPGHEFGEDETEEALLAGVSANDEPERRSASDGVGGLLSADLLDISEAIAQDAAKAARTVEEERKKGNGQSAEVKNETDLKDQNKDLSKVLFVIYSSPKFYDTRIKWARETWAKNLNPSQFVIIGDQGNVSDIAGAYVHQSRCKPNDKTIEMCCKYAEAMIVAQTMMWQNPNLQWAYMADDDSYIRASALEGALLKQKHTRPRDRGMVLGNYGCVTSNCSDLLCGGSGYAANRWAIDIMAGGDPAGFVQEVLQSCNRCGGDSVYNTGVWGDAGLSQVMEHQGIEQRKLEGLYGGLMDKSCLEFSLESEYEPLLYHQIRTQPQMEFLHRLFTHETVSSSSVPDGLGGCVEFRGNVQCAASRAEEDRPWYHGPSLCQRPRMPRLPILFGCFTLLFLFIIVSLFIWAGFRVKQHQWDGWKLQNLTGLKWHTYPMQGRSRIR